jgi:carbamoyl-phosphate synthase large subunit
MKQPPVTVLVTGAGSFCGVNIIHSLRHAGGYRIIAADIVALSAGLFLADRAYVIPKEGPDGAYIGALLDICRQEAVQALVPGFDTELPYLSSARAEFAALGVVPVIGDPEFIEIANCKQSTQQFLQGHGFPSLRSYRWEEKGRAIDELGLPLVVKPRQAWGARGFSVVWTKERLEQAVLDVLEAGWQPLVQEYVPDTEGEFTSSVMVATDYDVLGSICMRRELEKGSTRRIFVDRFQELRGQVEAIACALKTRGPVNLQFRVKDGRPYVFEFNARFSTTNVVRAVAGFNEVAVLVRNYLTGEKQRIKDYTPMVAVMYQDYVYAEPGGYEALLERGAGDRIGHLQNALETRNGA